MSVYKVTGVFTYNDHAPGEVFEALLDPGAEERAIARGTITLLERSTPALRPGSYRLPRGWAHNPETLLEGAGSHA